MTSGEAEAIQAVAVAKADALVRVGQSLRREGKDAAGLSVAEQYVKGSYLMSYFSKHFFSYEFLMKTAFGHLAKETNTLILNQDAGNITAAVTQALQVYKTVMNPQTSNSKKVKSLNHNSSVSQDTSMAYEYNRAEYDSDFENDKKK